MLFLPPFISYFFSSFNTAEVAHLVEHNLAKVGVAGSSPVFRSAVPPKWRIFFEVTNLDFEFRYSNFEIIITSPGGGTGRHAGLKILWPAMAVTVQLRSGALSQW